MQMGNRSFSSCEVFSTSSTCKDVEQVERREPGGELLQFLVVDRDGVEGLRATGYCMSIRNT